MSAATVVDRANGFTTPHPPTRQLFSAGRVFEDSDDDENFVAVGGRGDESAGANRDGRK